MKTTKSLIAFLAIIGICAFKPAMGQTITRNMVVEIYGVDYGTGIGTISGSYTYHFTFKLSKDGMMESMHYNVDGCDLVNENGEHVKVLDSGHDDLGLMWYFWNNPNISNTGWPIQYNVNDGWLDQYIPSVMPVEGTYMELACRVQYKNVRFEIGGMMQLHINANGDITALVKKGWCEAL